MPPRRCWSPPHPRRRVDQPTTTLITDHAAAEAIHPLQGLVEAAHRHPHRVGTAAGHGVVHHAGGGDRGDTTVAAAGGAEQGLLAMAAGVGAPHGAGFEIGGQAGALTDQGSEGTLGGHDHHPTGGTDHRHGTVLVHGAVMAK